MASMNREALASLGHVFALNSGFTLFSLDAATDSLEYIFHVQDPVTITRIGFRYGSRTGTPPTYTASLQSVDLTGNADGTIKGGASPASVAFTPPADTTWNSTWRWLNLANPYTATRGEALAFVIKHSSGTINGSNFSSFTSQWATIRSSGGFPYVIENNAGARTRRVNLPTFGYGPASVAYGYPVLNNTNLAINVNLTPDEIALAFTLDAGWGSTFKVIGARIGINLLGNAFGRLTLYDGTTALQQRDFDTDSSTALSNQLMDVFFDEDPLSELNFGSQYRLAFMTTSTSINQSPWYAEVDAAADWDAWPGGQAFYWSQRTDLGAWSDTLTRRPFIEPLLADWTEPAGGSGGPVGSGRLSGGLQ